MEIRKPKRVKHTYRQALTARPEEVLPMLCPVRECDWVEGWQPLAVHSQSGVVERDCIFATRDGEHTVHWFVVEHDMASGRVEMVNIAPGYLARRVEIDVSPTQEGSVASVTYTLTSLGPDGDAFVAEMTAEKYGQWMRQWEQALNAHLAADAATHTAR